MQASLARLLPTGFSRQLGHAEKWRTDAAYRLKVSKVLQPRMLPSPIVDDQALITSARAVAALAQYAVHPAAHHSASAWADGLADELLAFMRADGSVSAAARRWPPSEMGVVWQGPGNIIERIINEDPDALGPPPICETEATLQCTARVLQSLVKALPLMPKLGVRCAAASDFLCREGARQLMSALSGESSCAASKPKEFMHALLSAVMALREAGVALSTASNSEGDVTILGSGMLSRILLSAAIELELDLRTWIRNAPDVVKFDSASWILFGLTPPRHAKPIGEVEDAIDRSTTNVSYDPILSALETMEQAIGASSRTRRSLNANLSHALDGPPAIANGPKRAQPCGKLQPQPGSICAWKHQLELQRGGRLTTSAAYDITRPLRSWLLHGLLGENRSFPGLQANEVSAELEGFPAPMAELSDGLFSCSDDRSAGVDPGNGSVQEEGVVADVLQKMGVAARKRSGDSYRQAAKWIEENERKMHAEHGFEATDRSVFSLNGPQRCASRFVCGFDARDSKAAAPPNLLASDMHNKHSVNPCRSADEFTVDRTGGRLHVAIQLVRNHTRAHDVEIAAQRTRAKPRIFVFLIDAVSWTNFIHNAPHTSKWLDNIAAGI